MIKLFSTNCPKCKVLKSKLSSSNINYELIEDIDAVNKFADEHDVHEAPFMVLDDNTILNFKESLRYITAFNK